MTPTCKECRYYVPAKQEATNTPMGQCRRYPPAVLTADEIQTCNAQRISYTEMTRFPLVRPNHFCGEYKGTK